MSSSNGSSSTLSTLRIQSSQRSPTSSAMRPSPKLSWRRHSSITSSLRALLGSLRLGRLLERIQGLQEALSVLRGHLLGDRIEAPPSMMGLPERLLLLGWDIDRVRLAVGSELQVEVRPVPPRRVRRTSARGIAALPRHLGQRAMHHEVRQLCQLSGSTGLTLHNG